MTDKKMHKLLEQYANDIPLAKDIKVDISRFRKSFVPKDEEVGARYEDVILLSQLIQGAEHFLYWARRKKIL